MKYSYKKLKGTKNRDSIIIDKCKDKVVLHIGATDAPYTKQKLEKNLLLHTHIQNVAKNVIGLDIDKQSIEFLSDKGINNIQYFDMNNLGNLNANVDLIVFGEILEHLENLHNAFQNLKKVMHVNTELIITTPNLFYFHHTLQILIKNRELVHHDHKVGFTYGIINQLLNSNGLDIIDFYFSFLPRFKEKLDKKLIRLLCKFRPSLSENLVLIAKLKR